MAMQKEKKLTQHMKIAGASGPQKLQQRCHHQGPWGVQGETSKIKSLISLQLGLQQESISISILDLATVCAYTGQTSCIWH